MKDSHLTPAVLVSLLASGNMLGHQSIVRDHYEAASASAAAPVHTDAQAVVPRLIRFNGLLRDVSGKPLTGLVDVTFSLYSEGASGSSLWYET